MTDNTDTATSWRGRFAPHACVGPAYDLRDADLLAADPVDDAAPADTSHRRTWLRSIARDAIIYGLPAALQYVNLYRAVLGPGAAGEFNTWQHDRELATPDYAKFRTPNVDTLYSTAWLDLTRGPVEVTVPPMGHRYYTVNLLDAHSNAVNISTRTLGRRGGRVWILPAGWQGAVPAGVRRLRVTTPYQWVLMRIFVRSADDVADVRRLQDQVLLRSVSDTTGPGKLGRTSWPAVPDGELDGPEVLVVLDEVLRRNGHPIQEEAHLARFRVLGVGGDEPLDPRAWPGDVRAAVEAGHADAISLIRSVVALRGRPAGDSGWRTLSSGAYGYNYVHRAATNYVGLGATTREESGPYTALVDATGAQLDGRRGPYRLRLQPPPVDGFWSLTLYDLESRRLVPNPEQRYAVNSRIEGLPWDQDGSLPVHVGTDPGPPGTAWLPAPAAPFYLVLRAYLGRSEVVDGSWAPGSVERLGDVG